MKQTVAVALTWDGTRWPVGKLSPKARAFLAAQKKISLPKLRQATEWLEKNDVEEIRVCWIPALKGGDQNLAKPFAHPSGKRLAFRAAKIRQFGDVLGVIYRKI